MWYEKEDEKQQLRFDKPIFAKNDTTDEVLLLLPQLKEDTRYEIQGYNWFRLRDGGYNSCAFFPTPEKAMYSYRYGYTFFNREI